MDRRMGRGPFIGILAVLLVAQFLIATNTTFPNAKVAAAIPTLVGVVGVLALQLLKLPITVWRLNDIGRPASDSLFFVLLPIGNIVGFWRFCIEKTPSAKAWERRRRAWADQLGPVMALGQAFGLAAKTAHVVLPVVFLYGIVMAVVGGYSLGWLDWAAGVDAATRTLTGQALTLLSVLLLIYTVVQLAKRHKATRISWIPSLFLGPVVLLTLCLTFFEQGVKNNMQILLLQGVYAAWQMLWMSFGGAAVVVAGTLAAEKIRKKEPLVAGEVLGQVFPRTLDVAGPHGTKIQAVTIGLQILIPGIFYMLALAFSDTIAVLKPKAAALSDSMKLTWGMRARLFKLILAAVVATNVAHFVTVVAIEALPLPMNQGQDPTFVTTPKAQLSPKSVADGASGTVLVKVDVNEKGSVTGSTVVQSAGPGIDVSAQRAANAAKFAPAEMRGRPLAVSTVLSFDFDGGASATGTLQEVNFPGPVASYTSYFFDPRDLSLAAFGLGEVVWGISLWLVQLAMFLLYHDRVRFLEMRKAEREAKKREKAEAAAAQ